MNNNLTTTATNSLAKAWFGLTLGSDVISTWVLLNLINMQPDIIIPTEKKREISATILCFMTKFFFCVNPQIKVKNSNDWDKVSSEKPFVMLLNHTSPADVILLYSTLPLAHASKTRTLVKADLMQVPFFGKLLKQCGHFPVHFKHAEDGKFSVDADKQALVNEAIKQHLANGGSLALFPEGQINKGDINKLQPFRHGLFKMIEQFLHTINVYSYVHTGVGKTWDPKATLGGNPSTIKYQISQMDLPKGATAEQVQSDMQKNLDSINVHSKIARPRAKL